MGNPSLFFASLLFYALLEFSQEKGGNPIVPEELPGPHYFASDITSLSSIDRDSQGSRIYVNMRGGERLRITIEKA